MKMKHYPLEILPLAIVLLFCLAVCVADSTTDARNQEQMANDGQGVWCIAKPNTDNVGLNRNINYSCGQNVVNCMPIQPGGSCFHPDTAYSHASYAMNLFYKVSGKYPWDCHFNGTGITVTQDPSFGTCIYPL